MGYSGDTYQIPCNSGGLTHNANVDMINPTDMIPPSRNLDLDEQGQRKRGGTSRRSDSDYNAAISGTPGIMGIYNFRLYDGTAFVIVATNDGKVYRAHDTTIKASGMSTLKYFDFETFANELYIVDGNNTPEKWTGTGNTSTLTDIPADWTGVNHPQWIVKHGRGNSERLWAGGVASQPQRIYASVDGDGDDFSDANVTTLDIETGDGFGIIGGYEWGDRLFAVGKVKHYIIDDLDVTTANWGYDAAQWEGGVCNFRCIVKTPNDIVCMMEDGEIYSVLTAVQYGDYKAASLLRPSFMHRWIREFVDLSRFDQFHGVFDPYQRCVRYFVVRKGQTLVNTCLKYYIDRPVREAWMVDDNQDNASGFNASSSAVVRTSAGSWKVYTGDYSGDIWRLNQANRNDNSAAYYAGFRTPNLPFDNARVRKKYKRGWLLTKPEGIWDLSIKWWVDGAIKTTRTISLAGVGGVLGSFTLGTDVLAGEDMIDTEYALGDTGKRIQFEVFNTNVDEDFYVSRILTDHKVLGARPS